MQDYEPSPSLSWTDETWAKLRKAKSIKELDAIWAPLEDAGRVDSIGGAEYRNAVRLLGLSQKAVVAAFERVVTEMKHLRDNCEAALDVGYATKLLDEAVWAYKLASQTLIP